MTINNKTNIIYLTEFNEFCYIIVILPRNKNLELAKLNISLPKILIWYLSFLKP